jgi:valyl-tRNA synthetase
MPFISEEIWQLISQRNDGESLMVSRMPGQKKFNAELIGRFETIKEIVSSIRTIRKEKDLPVRDKLELFIRADNDYDKHFIPVLIKMGNLSGVTFTDRKQNGAASFLVKTVEYYIPLDKQQDVTGELLKNKEELEYTKGFLESVLKKLENERFVQNAPAKVLELERKKKADTEAKIKSLEERIKELGKMV